MSSIKVALSFDRCPPIPKDLLDYLQRIFPNNLPKEPCEPAQLGVLIGNQKVIDHLKAQFKRQTEGAISSGTP